jgi:hypothetical protein
METTVKRRGETGAKQARAGENTKNFKCERCQTKFRCSDTLINHLAKKKQCKKADACKSSVSRLELLRAIDAKRAKDFEEGAFYQCKRYAFSTNKRNERNIHNRIGECRPPGSGGAGAGAITSSTVSTVSTISPVTPSTVSTSQLTDEQIRDRIQALQRMLVERNERKERKERERNEKQDAMRVQKQVPIDFIIDAVAQREFAAVVVKMHLGGEEIQKNVENVENVDDVADEIIRQVWNHVDHMLFSSTTSAAHIRLRERAGQAWRQPFRDAGMALADFDFDLEFRLMKKWWNDDAGPGAREQVLRVLARGGVKVVK